MTLNATPALTVAGLSYAYGKKKALDRVSFAVAPGECTILLGPNGAGKTTLFSLITRLYDSREGRILIAGHDVRKEFSRALAQLGVVFQQTTLDLDLTVLQNLHYHASLHGLSRRRADARIREELERQGMFERRKEKVRQLNGGHRRRVEIARALLHEPRLLLLDEPTVGLDVPSRKAIVDYVHRLCSDSGIAVLWATHLIDEIYENDRLVVLHKGAVRADGSIPEVLKTTGAETVGDAFHRLTREAA
ncbi:MULTISPECIES: ABC transporter ATP-binding protein [Methylocaldum]|jgi:ABC-2 type transport system ATP-binding protein|uniref:ABC transporter ATP-binding protein n=1 Tax=unclassified Methylocaldum TaxID=2622260 RepID=UPI00098B6E03|nr:MULTISPECIES: ABC transporter ATP-binding protein [unclassified Methylocaldum]MBP1148909.1 ABC-2 type transport system ATP-binding protein [Methylocaldum sp. RMAD-M]MVF20624.1 ATP-binding cassette domain-containing protein [Methylocaldum sp. BRCS4]